MRVLSRVLFPEPDCPLTTPIADVRGFTGSSHKRTGSLPPIGIKSGLPANASHAIDRAPPSAPIL